jgi:hypothetical protein
MPRLVPPFAHASKIAWPVADLYESGDYAFVPHRGRGTLAVSLK